MKPLRLAVIGVGHLGKEHARILSEMPDVELVGVADVHADQAHTVAARCRTRAFTDYRPLLEQVEAAVVAVPTAQHASLAAEFLRQGVALLVEKPLALNLEQAELLVQLSQQHGALLQVGHIERFNPAFEELGRFAFQPKFIECERLGPFTGRSTDIGVVLDLMIHDLDLVLALVQAPLRTVEALGMSVFGGHEDMADARLTFANGCVAQLRASRANRTTVRRMSIWAPEGFLSADWGQRRLTLVQPSEQVRRHGLDARQLTPAARAQLRDDLFGRHLEVLERDCRSGDPLTLELRHFVHCVQTGARPRISGEDGRKAMAVATRILQKIHMHSWDGRPAGPHGPFQLPEPCGPLFQPRASDAAA